MTEVHPELDEVFERIDDAFFALDDRWRFTFLNDSAEEFLNVDEEDVLGEVVWDEFQSAVGTTFQENYEWAMANQEPVSFEEYYPPLASWFEVNAYPSETGLSVYFRDVTERVERERELEQYERIVETVQDGIYIVDDGTFTMVNDAYAEMLGYSAEELVGSDVSMVVDEQTSAAARDIEAELEAGVRSTASMDATLERADGDTFEAEATFALIPGGNRVGVVREITERKERERKLELYERIVETVEDGVYAVDQDQTFVLVNDAFCEMSGYDRKELIGRHASTVHGDGMDEEAEQLLEAVTSGDRREGTVELALRRKDGDSVPVEARFRTFQFEAETGRCGVVRDISERKTYERRLVSLHDVARDLLRAGSDEEIAEIVTGALLEIVDVPAAGYYRHEPGRGLLTPVALADRDGIVNTDLPSVSPGEGSITGSVFRKGDTHLIDDIRDSPQFSGSLEGIDVRSGVFVPVGDHGVLIAGSPDVGAFDDETRQLVEIVATTAAVATDRIDHEQMLRRQRERLAALNDINSLVQGLSESMFDLSTRTEIEELVCDRLADSDSYTFAWVGVEDGHEVAVSTEAGVDASLTDLSVRTDDAESGSPTAEAHRTGEIQVVRDVRDDPRYEQWRDHARDHGSRSSASIPIVDGDDIYGTLNLYSDRVDAFGAEERDSLRRLGKIISHALLSVERDSELQHERNRLEFMNRLLRHNLLNSLNVTKARLDLVDGRVDYEVSDHLDVALDRTQEMIDFVETVRKLTKVIGSEDGQDLRSVDLGAVLSSRVERARGSYPNTEYTLDSAPSIEVAADDLLGEVLDNVLANAAQHNPRDDATVRVDTAVGGDEVVVSVADNGPGIPDGQETAIFGRVPKKFDEPSAGFGLYLVSEILDSYGGTITVEDNDPEGAIFRLTFQRA